HISVTLATWDAVWEMYFDSEWARQRLRLYGAQDRALEQFFKKLQEEMAEVAMKRHGRAKQLLMFFGAASIDIKGGLEPRRDQPVLGLMWSPVVAPHKPPQAPCSSQAATQTAASEPGPSTPLPAKRSKRIKAEQAAEPTKGKGGSTARQCIGESRWRPLELCWWPEQGKLPAKGKEYPGLGYKRLRDRPPKAQEQQQPAVAQ
ncbi:hypothetical protein QJQ45_026069, partial [Haematococcus lacustris]